MIKNGLLVNRYPKALLIWFIIKLICDIFILKFLLNNLTPSSGVFLFISALPSILNVFWLFSSYYVIGVLIFRIIFRKKLYDNKKRIMAIGIICFLWFLEIAICFYGPFQCFLTA